MALKSPEVLERGSPEAAQAAAKQKKDMEEVKSGLIDALSKKCQALSAAIRLVGFAKRILKHNVVIHVGVNAAAVNAFPANHLLLAACWLETLVLNPKSSRPA